MGWRDWLGGAGAAAVAPFTGGVSILTICAIQREALERFQQELAQQQQEIGPIYGYDVIRPDQHVNLGASGLGVSSGSARRRTWNCGYCGSTYEGQPGCASCGATKHQEEQ